jgi:uncharacterized FlaG/YvyC family protein
MNSSSSSRQQSSSPNLKWRSDLKHISEKIQKELAKVESNIKSSANYPSLKHIMKADMKTLYEVLCLLVGAK